MNEMKDWYPMDGAGERALYGNINVKIDGYKAKYPVLTTDYVEDIHTMCAAFIEAFDKIEYNRATAKQMTTWFADVVGSKQKGEAVPPPPVFRAFTMPATATVGLEQQCREFARLLKSQPNYDRADGLDLMIEREKASAKDHSEVVPELKLTVLDTKVRVEWKKAGFDALELQYRKAATTMWQPADKSTVNVFEFAPPLTPDTPEKFEFRAILLIKNQRVGNWSPTYTLTVG